MELDRILVPPMATTIQAPSPIPPKSNGSRPELFLLSGSIRPPPAPRWQTTISNRLSHLPITIINPLRPDWDPSWIEDAFFPPFAQQLAWEFNGLKRADVIAVFFAKGTLAPIALMELCMAVQRPGKRVVVVACEERYWMRATVEAICERYRIRLLGNVEELIQAVAAELETIIRGQVGVGSAA